jgi:hypothetical protein
MPSTGSHTQIELANATLGPNNDTLWYVYNLHITAEPEGGDGGGEHSGLKMQAVTDTYFTPQPSARPKTCPTSRSNSSLKTQFSIFSSTEMSETITG